MGGREVAGISGDQDYSRKEARTMVPFGPKQEKGSQRSHRCGSNCLPGARP